MELPALPQPEGRAVMGNAREEAAPLMRNATITTPARTTDAFPARAKTQQEMQGLSAALPPVRAMLRMYVPEIPQRVLLILSGQPRLSAILPTTSAAQGPARSVRRLAGAEELVRKPVRTVGPAPNAAGSAAVVFGTGATLDLFVRRENHHHVGTQEGHAMSATIVAAISSAAR